ncbi:sugar transporter STL1 [Trichodelitschia bisporula]|uniref:Sugar transporter STL1 n=1 Tax=Trichodelitschia bisporula TaxID=703511 RepID=A0A6G1I9Y4_9PEZI|nr:sugar transporter STL1 [Trichodelitschia bisporula]
MALPPKIYQFLVAVFASLGSLLYGYDLGVIAEAIASENFTNLFNPTKNEIGAVVSVFTGGGFFGAALAGPLGDRWGRKWTILTGALVFCLGGALQTGAQNLGYLYAGRAIAGLGVGVLVMIVPLYQAELCHPSIRGRVTTLQQFMLGIGALIASGTGYGAYTGFPATSSKQWRVSLGIQIIPAALLAALILLFPESPRWLIAHDRAEDGLVTLAQLHARGDTEDVWVRAEWTAIQDAVAVETAEGARSYGDLFKKKSSARRLFLAVALQASVQMTGVSAIQYYSVTIFNQMGISGGDTLKYQTYNSVIALVAQALCMLLVDRLGRRWPLILGNLGNCVTFIAAACLLAKYPPDALGGSNAVAARGFIAATWLFNFSFSATCGPLSWIIPAEIFDTATRAKGVSIATMTSFAFNTMIGQTTSVAMETIKWRWYILFVVCNFTNAVFFWAFMPETKNRPLEEMDYLFTNAPLFVPFMDVKEYESHDLERRVEEQQRKGSVEHVTDVGRKAE